MILPSHARFFIRWALLTGITMGGCWSMGARFAAGHGTPIRVDVVDNQLAASGGIIDPGGFVEMVFADPIPDSAFLSAPDNILLTDFPGYDINGMLPDSQLFVQPLGIGARRDNELQERVLWYWSAVSEQVETAPHEPTLRLLSTRGFGEASLPQWGPPPPAQLVGEPQASDLGEHRHLAYYVLDDSPPAAHGVYAFFAQLTSPGYETSEPFLIALNHGLPGEVSTEGALAINRAALLAGDYDRNGVVDVLDYDLWKQQYGSSPSVQGAGADGNRDGRVNAADFVTWRNHALADAPAVLRGLPEPGGGALLVLATALLATWRSQAGLSRCG